MRKQKLLRFLCAASAVMLMQTVTAPAYAAVLPDEAPTVVQYAPHILADSDSESELVYDEIPVTSFRVCGLSPELSEEEDGLSWFYSKWDDCRYLFLPACANRSRLKVEFELAEDAQNLALDGFNLQNNTFTNIFTETEPMQITVDGKDCGKLYIMQSTLGSMYLTTDDEGGNTDTLDKHRSHVSTGSAVMLEADGSVVYHGEIEKIKNHGNSSWDYSAKKSYNIKLPKKADLYGMGKAKKWALLSNFLDHSMLRNAYSQEMSKAGKLEYTMDYTFVDLYSGGEYRGTYQLSERVQIQKQRINIRDLEEETEKLNELPLEEYNVIAAGAYPNEYKENSWKGFDIPNNPEDITGGYLLQFQLYNRYGYKATSGFVTSRGQAISIDGPEYASPQQISYIRNFVQDMEDAIYSPNGTNSKGKHYSEYIDVDSLIRAYLVREISEDADGTYTSFFLWKDSDSRGDGKLHCSPCWDFDFAYNNFARNVENIYAEKTPAAHCNHIGDLYVANMPIHGYASSETSQLYSGRPVYGASWVTQLYYKDRTFRKRVAELYFADFDEFLAQTAAFGEDSALKQLYDFIEPSGQMNMMRWHTYSNKTYMYNGTEYYKFGQKAVGWTFEEHTEIIRKFVSDRRDALRKVWCKVLAEDYGDQLDAACDALPLNRYDAEGIAMLVSAVDLGREAILEQSEPADCETAYQAALASLSTIPRAWIPGDFNDDLKVDLDDATDLLRHYGKSLTGLPTECSPTQRHNGDVDGNDTLDALDAMHVLSYYAASLKQNQLYIFPVQEN